MEKVPTRLPTVAQAPGQRVTSRLQYVQYMLKDERTPILIPFESLVMEAILRW